MARWLKFIFLGLAIAVLLVLPAQAQINPSRCTYNGLRLYGKIQVVQALPDLKIQAVNSAQDVNVQLVPNSPRRCGEWQIVNIFPDVKVQFVNIFPDLKIKFVNNNPGIPRIR